MISFYVIGSFDICLSNLLHLKWNVQTAGSIPLAGHGKLLPTLQSGPGQRRRGTGGAPTLPRPSLHHPLRSLQNAT